MIKKWILSLMIILLAVTVQAQVAHDESITSFYPTPFGAYDKLRLAPQPPIVGTCEIGTIYVDNVTKLLQICLDDGLGSSTWNTLATNEVWSQSGTDLFPVDTSANVNVGIGTNTPQSKLHIKHVDQNIGLRLENQDSTKTIQLKFARGAAQTTLIGPRYDEGGFPPRNMFDIWTTEDIPIIFGTSNTEAMRLTTDGYVGIGTETPEGKLVIQNDGGILAKGTFGAGAALTTSGAGKRLIWYPRKAAFRAGSATADRWNDANIGTHSTVLVGQNSPPTSGDSAVSLGGSFGTPLVSGLGAVSLNGSVASGTASLSTLGGKATGEFSSVLAFACDALGDYSTCMASGATASGVKSLALRGIASGMGAVSISAGSGAAGYASGDHSVNFGWYTTAQAYASVVIGRDNIISGTTNAWVDTDPIFVIGNGVTLTPKNAWTVLKNGNIGINVTNPTKPLHVNSVMKIEPTAAPPACAENGLLYVDPSGALCYCDGNTWQIVATNSGTCAP